MNLASLFKPIPSVQILPELRQKCTSDIREHYQRDIEPELWHNYFKPEPDDALVERFLNRTSEVVQGIISKHVPNLPDDQLHDLTTKLWEESQAYWYEYARELKPILEFSNRLLIDAKQAVQHSFPESEVVFGPMATTLLVDLEFQYAFYRYSKIAKPDLTDFRRMINTMGQIVEAVFASKVLQEDLTLGGISEKLESFTHRENKERKTFFAAFKDASTLTTKPFRTNLRVIQRKRNPYSHGWQNNSDSTRDFEECVNAMLGEPSGVLPTLYKLLKRAKRSAAAS